MEACEKVERASEELLKKIMNKRTTEVMYVRTYGWEWIGMV